MDGDDFSRATRLGRTAVAAIWDSISNGAPFDGFATGQLIDRFVGHADGIPSLQPILTVLEGLAAEPLFIQAGIADAIDRVDDAAAVADATMLDLQLRDVVTSSLLRNEIDPRPILERFFAEFIERNVIMARNGLVESHGLQHAQAARDLIAPLVRAAAAELLRRPDAKRLGLTREFFERLNENSNLLGAA
jgi:hypothetical protein